MGAITRDEARWQRTVDRVADAHALSTSKLAGGDENGRWNRAWIFGALLSELPSRAAAESAIRFLRLPEGQRASPPFGREQILAGYDHYHGREVASAGSE